MKSTKIAMPKMKKMPCRKAAGGSTDEKWMQSPGIKKGGLHKSLGIPMGQKIGEKRIKKAEHARSPLTRKQAHLAEIYSESRPKGK